MQAAVVCSKLVSYTLLLMIFAVVANGVRKDMLVWSVQSGYDLVTLEIRMWELLPASLMVATSSALVAEVWHPPFSLCLMVHPACFSTGLSCPNKLYTYM